MSRFCTNLEGITKSENGILSKATKTSGENKEKYQLEDCKLIQYIIIQTNIIRTVWQTVERITNEILGVEGLNQCWRHCRLQSTADQSLALFSGMSSHSQTDSTTVSALFDSNT
ncbi:unnamed protein product [Pocillopora meandrina]|uniref:Uncharacterized protein n=1 Tax=Pocillopora meandrina TaxID=46732 RepID=A0AAU9W9B6_9CNID|nr:unnamed protein product [Pocillopora meandrina]